MCPNTDCSSGRILHASGSWNKLPSSKLLVGAHQLQATSQTRDLMHSLRPILVTTLYKLKVSLLILTSMQGGNVSFNTHTCIQLTSQSPHCSAQPPLRGWCSWWVWSCTAAEGQNSCSTWPRHSLDLQTRKDSDQSQEVGAVVVWGHKFVANWALLIHVYTSSYYLPLLGQLRVFLVVHRC